MDDFERKLKRDAANIPAGMTPELQARMRASLEAQLPPRARPRQASPGGRWLAASIARAAAAAAVIALLPRAPQPLPQPVADVPAVQTDPGHPTAFDRPLPLQVEASEFTAPLEQELENLRADLEQARRSVAEDVAF